MSRRQQSMLSLVKEYLAFRRKLGCELRIDGQLLLGFGRFADQSAHAVHVTTALAVRWATLPRRTSAAYQRHRLGIVRGFARYRLQYDPRTEVPPADIVGAPYRRVPPYIYINDEIAALIAAASDLPPRGGLRAKTAVAIFGLLASTGLRISEAIKLTLHDVDLDLGVLRIVQGKFHKARLVPVHHSTMAALRQYIQHRNRHPRAGETQAFFLNAYGRPLTCGSAQSIFRKLRQELGWAKSTGRLRRIHDLRHTFAVHRILRWYEEGANVDHKIAGLATYLGHTHVSDTYWYLAAVPELFALTSARFERYATSGRAR